MFKKIYNNEEKMKITLNVLVYVNYSDDYPLVIFFFLFYDLHKFSEFPFLE